VGDPGKPKLLDPIKIGDWWYDFSQEIKRPEIEDRSPFPGSFEEGKIFSTSVSGGVS